MTFLTRAPGAGRLPGTMEEDLRELIRESLVPVAALARSCGVSRQYLYQVMDGLWQPNDELLSCLAERLGYKRSTVRAAIAESRKRAGR